MQQLVEREEAGGVDGDTPRALAAAPPVLPMSEALAAAAALADRATAAATAASLEAALPAVRRQLRENALRSLQVRRGRTAGGVRFGVLTRRCVIRPLGSLCPTRECNRLQYRHPATCMCASRGGVGRDTVSGVGVWACSRVP